MASKSENEGATSSTSTSSEGAPQVGEIRIPPQAPEVSPVLSPRSLEPIRQSSLSKIPRLPDPATIPFETTSPLVSRGKKKVRLSDLRPQDSHDKDRPLQHEPVHLDHEHLGEPVRFGPSPSPFGEDPSFGYGYPPPPAYAAYPPPPPYSYYPYSCASPYPAYSVPHSHPGEPGPHPHPHYHPHGHSVKSIVRSEVRRQLRHANSTRSRRSERRAPESDSDESSSDSEEELNAAFGGFGFHDQPRRHRHRHHHHPPPSYYGYPAPPHNAYSYPPPPYYHYGLPPPPPVVYHPDPYAHPHAHTHPAHPHAHPHGPDEPADHSAVPLSPHAHPHPHAHPVFHSHVHPHHRHYGHPHVHRVQRHPAEIKHEKLIRIESGKPPVPKPRPIMDDKPWWNKAWRHSSTDSKVVEPYDPEEGTSNEKAPAATASEEKKPESTPPAE